MEHGGSAPTDRTGGETEVRGCQRLCLSKYGDMNDLCKRLLLVLEEKEGLISALWTLGWHLNRGTVCNM